MILELLLILVLFWLFATWSRNSQGISAKHRKIAQKIQELGAFAEAVCDYAAIPIPSWDLRPSETMTWTQNQKTVYLLLWNPSTQDLFDDTTLRYAVLHEMAHVLCSTSHHTPEFDQIEETLLTTAEKLGLYRSRNPLDPSYPCVSCT